MVLTFISYLIVDDADEDFYSQLAVEVVSIQRIAITMESARQCQNRKEVVVVLLDTLVITVEVHFYCFGIIRYLQQLSNDLFISMFHTTNLLG